MRSSAMSEYADQYEEDIQLDTADTRTNVGRRSKLQGRYGA